MVILLLIVWSAVVEYANIRSKIDMLRAGQVGFLTKAVYYRILTLIIMYCSGRRTLVARWSTIRHQYHRLNDQLTLPTDIQ